MVQLSVCICTHNPREEYLDRTLESLAQQTVPKKSWELLIIDNASSKPVKDSFSLDWHPNARHLQEEKIGLTMARLRAIAETETPLLLFVDDDNVLSEDYLENLLELERKMPFIGCFGAGILEPEYEEQPAEELQQFMPMLALRTVPKALWGNYITDAYMPFGAGLALRRNIAVEYRRQVMNCKIRSKLGRSGTALLSGEDDEISWLACQLNYGIGSFPMLQIKHLISANRVQIDYLLKLAEGHAFSRKLLAHLHHGDSPSFLKPSWAGALLSLLKLKRSLFFYHIGLKAKKNKKIASEFAMRRAKGVCGAQKFIDNLLNSEL